MSPLLLALSLCSPVSAGEEIVTTGDGLVARPLTVQLLDDGQPVRGVALQGTWWPDSRDESLSRAGTTDAQGQLEWAPPRSGVVALEGDGGRALLRVATPSPSPLSLVLTLLLALLPLLASLALMRPVARWWTAGSRVSNPDARTSPETT